ncbi:16S rRNA (uracil(1498)-N(3))-methyltransferase [Enteractinococcus coprophilus]|uniref:Ribosomal RNA small subunit methyltransferase E n=1 Tax=Enteractinococcus coprophilus TaxID=1027633 RepID=A0A543AJL5_9MICC|nr:16S rRNA (uracil(1498)-N(3))-methyltransferase [Enteractinococcus coprophilus]TQL72716.1 16S rRNA (uracil1498-N3)-methyltransferase [Enteractinococcus coprophilus]
MTHPLFYSAHVAGVHAHDVVDLDEPTSGHAIRSQRLQVGDPVLLSDGHGTLASGVIEVADPRTARVRVTSVSVQYSPSVRINLVQALAKGDRDLLAAEMATELGVDTVTPWQSQRSIVRIRTERAEKMLTKWRSKLHAAAQQSRRAIIPKLEDPLITTDVARLHNAQDGQHVVVLHEDGVTNIEQAVVEMSGVQTIHLVVGPEGGVAPEELAAIENAGGTAVKIGDNVLRSSTAGPVAITLLNQIFKRW